MPDLVDEMFGDTPEGEEEYYPGSKRKIEREKPTDVEFIADPWQENYTMKKIGGIYIPMYPIGALADALGVSVQTVRYWTSKGHIPDAPFRLPSNMIIGGQKTKGRRLYTEEMIQAAVQAFEERGLLGVARIEWKTQLDLVSEIQRAWTRAYNKTTAT